MSDNLDVGSSQTEQVCTSRIQHDESLTKPNTLLNDLLPLTDVTSNLLMDPSVQQLLCSHINECSTTSLEHSTTLGTCLPEPLQPSITNQTAVNDASDSFFSSLVYKDESSYYDLPSRPLSIISTLNYYAGETRTILDQLTFLQHAYPPEIQEELDLLAEILHYSARRASRTSRMISQHDQSRRAETNLSRNGTNAPETMPTHQHEIGPINPLVSEKASCPHFHQDNKKFEDDASSGTFTSAHTRPSLESVGLAVNPTPLQYAKYKYRRAKRSLASLSSLKR